MSYIGTEPKDIRSFGRTKFDYTATQGQTAFTGADDDGKVLAFTTGQIEVYVNGILMDDSDFSTTGTGTVTLASAANLNDVVNVVSFETNIPDSNYVPASGGTFTGAVTAANGLTVDDDGATPLTVDRATSFGNVVDIQKDGSTVGGISTFYGNPMFGRNSGARLAFDTNVIYSSNDAGSTADNAYALGSASSRFTDIYLSGGAYLGGTGAANKLDDYEEGTWTPSFSFSGGSVGYSYQAGQYTKIGRKVFVTANMILNSASNPTGAVHVVTLPFTSGDDSNAVIAEGYVAGVTYSLVRNLTTQSPNIRGYVPRNSTYMLLTNNHTGQGHVAFNASLLGSSTLLYMSATYFAAA